MSKNDFVELVLIIVKLTDLADVVMNQIGSRMLSEEYRSSFFV